MSKAPASASASKELAVAEDPKAGALVVSTGEDYSEYEGLGFANQTEDDYSIPFFGVLQGLSPACETVDGAKPGLIINTVTNDLYRDGIVFVPCDTAHVVVEWRPKAAGGGIVATHKLNHDLVVHAKETQDFGAWKTPSGNELVETFYVYGIRTNREGTDGEHGVIAFTSTKIKKYKSWMTTAKGVTINIKDAQGRVIKRVNPPLFAHRFLMTTVKEKNTKGEFFNWAIKWDGEDAVAARIGTKSDLFQSAAALFEMVQSGKAKANLASLDGADTSTDAASSAGMADRTDTNAPF